MVENGQFSQLNILKNLEKKEFEFFSQDRKETTKFWEIRNSEDTLFLKSAFNTLPWMKDYDLDKEGILKDTKKTTNEFKTTFQV